jgi:hypothetical protein
MQAISAEDGGKLCTGRLWTVSQQKCVCREKEGSPGWNHAQLARVTGGAAEGLAVLTLQVPLGQQTYRKEEEEERRRGGKREAET